MDPVIMIILGMMTVFTFAIFICLCRFLVIVNTIYE